MFYIFVDFNHIVIIKIEPRNRNIAGRVRRLLHNGDSSVILIHLYDAKLLGGFHPVSRNGGPLQILYRISEDRRESLTVEDVIPQNQADSIISDRLLTDDKRLSQ